MTSAFDREKDAAAALVVVAMHELWLLKYSAPPRKPDILALHPEHAAQVARVISDGVGVHHCQRGSLRPIVA